MHPFLFPQEIISSGDFNSLVSFTEAGFVFKGQQSYLKKHYIFAISLKPNKYKTISRKQCDFLGKLTFFVLPQQVSWGKYKLLFVKALCWRGYGKYEFPKEKIKILEETL